MNKQRAPAICSGYGKVGLHMAEPGERLVGALCRACRKDKAAAK